MPKASASTDGQDASGATTVDTSDIAELSYEQARDELSSIVTRLEGGGPSLEDSMRLWERGEALAAHCQRWLDGAEQRIRAMSAEQVAAAADRQD